MVRRKSSFCSSTALTRFVLGTEIGEQIELLEEVDEQVECTSGRMGSALRKIDKLLTAAGDRGALFIVVFLILVLIGLVILVFKV